MDEVDIRRREEDPPRCGEERGEVEKVESWMRGNDAPQRACFPVNLGPDLNPCSCRPSLPLLALAGPVDLPSFSTLPFSPLLNSLLEPQLHAYCFYLTTMCGIHYTMRIKNIEQTHLKDHFQASSKFVKLGPTRDPEVFWTHQYRHNPDYRTPPTK